GRDGLVGQRVQRRIAEERPPASSRQPVRRTCLLPTRRRLLAELLRRRDDRTLVVGTGRAGGQQQAGRDAGQRGRNTDKKDPCTLRSRSATTSPREERDAFGRPCGGAH